MDGLYGTHGAPQLTVHNVIAEGDFVTAYGDMTMKDKDGAVVPYAYCDIYHFRGDTIVELRAFVIQTVASPRRAQGLREPLAPSAAHWSTNRG